MTQQHLPPVDEWPMKKVFFVEIEDHCEDGEWSGHAHSDEFPRSQDTQKAILFSEHESALAKKDAEIAELRIDFENKRSLAIALANEKIALQQENARLKEKAGTLVEALGKLKRANERKYSGADRDNYALSRVDLAAIADQAIAEWERK